MTKQNYTLWSTSMGKKHERAAGTEEEVRKAMSGLIENQHAQIQRLGGFTPAEGYRVIHPNGLIVAHYQWPPGADG